jgi:hypothetical protein
MKTKLKLPALAAIITLLVTCAAIGSPGRTLAGTKPYPLKVCLVTDNDLDSMGDQQVHNYNGQQLKFCCDACYKKLLKNPAKYLAKLK